MVKDKGNDQRMNWDVIFFCRCPWVEGCREWGGFVWEGGQVAEPDLWSARVPSTRYYLERNRQPCKKHTVAHSVPCVHRLNHCVPQYVMMFTVCMCVCQNSREVVRRETDDVVQSIMTLKVTMDTVATCSATNVMGSETKNFTITSSTSLNLLMNTASHLPLGWYM